jgi:pSer/pThr/pTyr-binding forkhead associated (FHA) protein
VDDEPEPKQIPLSPASAQAPVLGQRFWLEHGGRLIALDRGRVAIGRSSSCQIILDDPLISRRHAELSVASDKVTVEDAGSVNGVFVNSRRISAPQPLQEGDQIQLGTQVLVLRAAPESVPTRLGERLSAETLRGLEIPGDVPSRPLNSVLTETESTFSVHTLDLLGGVADKVLALGRGEEAEKILATTLKNLLTDVRTRGVLAHPEVFEKAVRYSVRLAEATGRGRWIDYAIELYAALKRPLPTIVVDQFYTVIRKVDAVNLTSLRAYLAVLRGMQSAFAPTERFVLQRLEGFERLASLK